MLQRQNKREAEVMPRRGHGRQGVRSRQVVSRRRSIRRRARAQLKAGAVTDNYQGTKQAIDLLNHAVATEIVCVLRYKYRAVVATAFRAMR